MRLIVRCLVFGLLAVLLASCAQDVVEEEKKAEVKQDRLVGKVASVFGKEGEGYVLVQRYSSFQSGGDRVFYVRGSGDEMTSLKLTGERLGQFVAADIVKGAPVVGDPVFERVFEKEESQAGRSAAEGVTLDRVLADPLKPASE